jgi:hypothetical protein
MLKLTTLAAMVVIALPAIPVVTLASELRMTVEKPHFTCDGRGSLLSHASYVPGAYKASVDEDAPLPCCDGQVGCAQFLSTNTILHPDLSLRG